MEKLAELQTGTLGGVEDITDDMLDAMQQGQYVLRAHKGKLTRAPAERSTLPKDPKAHPQGQSVGQASDGTIYVRQRTLISKSTDGAKTWTNVPHTMPEEWHYWQVLSDGAFIGASVSLGPGATDPGKVFISRDEGQSWRQIGEVPAKPMGEYDERYGHWGLSRLSDDTLFWGFDFRQGRYEPHERDRPGEQHGKLISGENVLVHYRSADGGNTWEGPITVTPWGSEGDIAELPSGKLLATVRYSRWHLASDPPDVRKRLGSPEGEVGYGMYKHLFLMDSDDRGRSWKNLRQICTVFGQCFGTPVVLRDNTAVVIHETRYGPHPQSGRAMISKDGGQTWEDEVYYVYYGKTTSSYSRNILLEDDTILTVAGTYDADNPASAGWGSWIGDTVTTAIRWRPVKD